jgi:hypothetical protein
MFFDPNLAGADSVAATALGTARPSISRKSSIPVDDPLVVVCRGWNDALFQPTVEGFGLIITAVV